MVTTSVGNSLLAESVFLECWVRVDNNDMVTDLIPLDIYDFGTVIGIDWLVNHHAIVYYFRKEITFRKFGESDITFRK